MLQPAAAGEDGPQLRGLVQQSPGHRIEVDAQNGAVLHQLLQAAGPGLGFGAAPLQVELPGGKFLGVRRAPEGPGQLVDPEL